MSKPARGGGTRSVEFGANSKRLPDLLAACMMTGMES
jgi:hypothetical protein